MRSARRRRAQPVSLVAFPLALLPENGQERRPAFKGATKALDEFVGDGLEDEAVAVLKEDDFGAFADGVFFAESSRDNQLTFRREGGLVAVHGDLHEKNTRLRLVSQ